ncbi:hypothetical protein HYU17_05915 [Candidatus Woesearchaeota archaeon]|nr:hypothetical protein [Candidatus Woesearchaeota archaeon]
MNCGNGKKRTFSELRHIILTVLLPCQQTTNQISVMTGINWRTVEAHLTFLIGKGLVVEVLKSEYVRIFKLTEEGRAAANSLYQPLQQEMQQLQKKEGVIEL